MQAGSEVWLWQANVVLGFQEQVGEQVGGILPVTGLSSDGHIEADGEAGKKFRTVCVSHVDDLVELNEQGINQLNGTPQIDDTSLQVFHQVREEILVHSAW